MEFNEYQDLMEQTALGYATSDSEGVSQIDSILFLCLALNGEAGEVAEKAKRVLRGDGDLEDIEDELGDCLWYLSRLSGELGMEMNEVAERNVEKILDREERGVIKGEGDNR